MRKDTALPEMNELLRWPMSDQELRELSTERLFYARSFLSRPEDLDLGFKFMQRPVLITSILANCLYREDGGRFAESELWQWSLKKRLQALLAIVVATRGNHLTIMESCGSEPCQEIMEMIVDLTAFENSWEQEIFSSQPEPDTVLQIRLPRGSDQLQWLEREQASADNDRWFSEMATDLVIDINGQEPENDWCVPVDWLERIGADLEDNDAYASLQFSTRCPFCQKTSEFTIDLEDRLLAELSKMQKQMFQHIHCLASVYHWSEAEIVALSPWRRNFYLKQIEEGQPG